MQTPLRSRPSRAEKSTEVTAAERSSAFRSAPKYWAAMILVPLPIPAAMELAIHMMGPGILTAPSAVGPTKLPTTMASTME